MLNSSVWKRAVLLVSIMALLAPTLPSAAAPTPALEKVIEAAKKEREMKMVIGGWGPQQLWDEITALTKKIYGVDVKVTFGSGPNLSRATARGLQEYAAGQPASTDAFLDSPRLAFSLTDKKVALKVNWRELKPDLPAKVINDASTGLIVSGTTGGIVYNTKMMRAEDMPQTVEDLLDPKYKGKIVSTSTASQWSEIAVLKGEKLVTRVINGIAKNGNLVGVEPGCGDKDLIAAGQYAMQAFYCVMYEAQNYADQTGAPLGLTFLKDAKWVAPYHWIIPKNGKSQNVAILVGLTLATTEAQKIMDKWQGRTSPYIPGGRIYTLTQEGQKSGGKDFLIDTWDVIRKYRNLYTGKIRRGWQKTLRGR